MGPNQADIIRVSTRELGGQIADVTLDPSKDAEVVVEVEAGSAVFGLGAHWQIGLHIRDLDGGAIPFVLAPTPKLHGHMNEPGDVWDTRAKTFRYTIEKATLGTHKGHVGRVHAHLLVGTGPANYDATFVESEPFLVLP
jgi:hypothetical protein